VYSVEGWYSNPALPAGKTFTQVGVFVYCQSLDYVYQSLPVNPFLHTKPNPDKPEEKNLHHKGSRRGTKVHKCACGSVQAKKSKKIKPRFPSCPFVFLVSFVVKFLLLPALMGLQGTRI
jgi:hypothetical protein